MGEAKTMTRGVQEPRRPQHRETLPARRAITDQAGSAGGPAGNHPAERRGHSISSITGRRSSHSGGLGGRPTREAGRPGPLLHDLRRSAVRNLERAGILRPVAVKFTDHKTEAVYRRYAIVAQSDLREAGAKLAAALGTRIATGSLSDNSGDNPVTARKERSLHA